jgi:hypothetical protein
MHQAQHTQHRDAEPPSNSSLQLAGCFLGKGMLPCALRETSVSRGGGAFLVKKAAQELARPSAPRGGKRGRAAEGLRRAAEPCPEPSRCRTLEGSSTGRNHPCSSQ